MRTEIVITVFLSVFLISCSGVKKRSFKYNQSSNPWISTYKLHVFCTCLLEGYKIDSTKGYQSDTLIRYIKRRDPIVVYDELNFLALESADKLGIKIASGIPKVALPAEIYGEEESFERKFVMMNCLNYYDSKELDSIAKSWYKAYLKGVRKDKQNDSY
ncbi:hypothetical protein E6C50_07060 [Flavobacterium supellecticarium]|uniref:Lipoprotein n=1 Tax=Flavobacterium supellecticarium TaxID=2565924 RepID=A0A4S3ZZR8_9FLAO|nr:hypothetical protein [Flavobacterium supellecticarium]THF51514.1 hypothetical protein E6C50_07060 [Flavobacterium supellecticarium]